MKKTAVLIYNNFCNFEFSVALEILAMKGKPITIFAKTLEPIKSEEGLRVLPEKTIDQLDLEEYDSLILTGASNILEAFEDESIIEFIKKFNDKNMIIGAISIGPVLLLKAGILKGKPFMIGSNPEDLYEVDFTEDDLKYMIGWNESIKNPVEDGYIITDNIITSVSYDFVKWGIAFCKMIGVETDPRNFGLPGVDNENNVLNI